MTIVACIVVPLIWYCVCKSDCHKSEPRNIYAQPPQTAQSNYPQQLAPQAYQPITGTG